MREIDFDNNDRIRYKKIFNALESKGKSIEEYEAIFEYITNASPKLVTVIAGDILNDWTCDDVLFYLKGDIREKRVLFYRQAYIHGLSISQKTWLMFYSAIFQLKNEIYDISLEALANKVPFEIIERLWTSPEYSIESGDNIQLYNMFITEGHDVSQSLYLTYIFIRYPKEVLEECEQLFEAQYDIEQIHERMTVKYNSVYEDRY